MKKLFLDEMMNGYKDYFVLLGYDVVCVADERMQGSSDAEVIAQAMNDGRLFVTQDYKAHDVAQTVGAESFLVTNGLVVKAIVEALTVGGKQ